MPLAKRPQPPIGRDSKRPRPSLENASTPGRGATRKASPPSSPAFPDMTAAELELMNGLFAGIDAEVRCSPQKAALPLNRSPRKLSASPTKRPKPASSSLPRPKDAAVGSARIPLSPRKMNVPLLQGRKTTAAKPGGDQPRRKSADPMDFLGLAPAKRVAVAATRPPPKPSAPPPPKIFPPVQKPPTPKKTTVPPPPASVPSLSQESVEDYDGGWDMDALGSMDEAALLRGPEKYPLLHPPVPPRPEGYNPAPWARSIVDNIREGLVLSMTEEPLPRTASMFATREKTLFVTLTETGTQRIVHLKDRWADLKVRPKDIVNIVSHNLTTDGPIVVTMKDTSACLIHHPDILVTMTAVADAMPCPRRPLVQSLVKFPEPVSKPMLYGTVLHSLLQGSLSEQTFDPASTARRVAAELASEERRLEVWGAGFSPDDMIEDLGPKAQDAFSTFGNNWIGPEPKDTGLIITARDEPCGYVVVKGLHDIEEAIWSPKWGLQGKVDASVQAVLRRENGETEEFVAPLEIKTGRSIGGLNHRAQTMLYTLLMEDRYKVPVPAGLLYYSQRSSIVLVEARANEVRALIMSRNELAEWMARERSSKASTTKGSGPAIEEAFLPETIDRPKDCQRCYGADACMLYRKAVDHVPPPDDDPITELFETKTGHLTDAHAVFFKHWERLLSLEELDTNRLRAQLWTMTAKARERAGRCFADMVLSEEVNDVGKSLAKIHRWSYTFNRSQTGEQAPPSLLSGHMSRGDPIQISLEPDLLCLARGFVTELTGSSVTVAIQAKLEIEELIKRTRGSLPTEKLSFRIDKDELSSGMARMRGNLAHMFLADGDAVRRRLVVDLAPPSFDESRAPTEDEIPKSLNDDQRVAMTKVLTAKDYALILGMPGTGKTTTVAEIISAIVARGQTVLLTSYTHSAVDTIVVKLLGADFEVLRIGNSDKVHPDVKHLTLEAQGPSSSPEQLEARLMTPPVVATTCLSVNHPLFFRRHFDYCIVDEASQITLPTCLGPLRCADKFVLVGDHFQLPPIVRKAEARAGGLDVSLFRRLSDAHPDAVAPLAAQYRMNADIMHLSNRLIYENRLRCGSEQVANQVLTLKSHKTCGEIGSSRCSEDCWVQDLMQESAKAIFVDTDLIPGDETRVGDLVQNPTEAELLFTLARALVASGVRQHDIAAITPYRQQIKLLTAMFASLPNVELLTADKAQGRDKDVVLVSLVRSNEHGHVGDLLRDWRRINVSFTRAKKKLVIFGSRRTLSSDRLLADFFALVDEQQWVRQLPVGANRLHDLPSVDIPEAHRSPRKGVVSQRLLASKPFIKEILDADTCSL